MTNSLEKVGFKRAEVKKYKRLLLNLEGEEKTGKTHFSLTAPGGIAYFDSDVGSEGVLDHFIGEKEIFHYEINIAKDIIVDSSGPRIDATKELGNFKEAYEESLKNESIKTIVYDNASEIWELVRLAMFGQLEQVPAHFYTQANEEYRRLIRKAYYAEKNLILIHKLKDEYVGSIDAKGRYNSVKTGKRLRTGFSDLGYLIQANLVTNFDHKTKKFSVYIRDCRQNMGLAGETLEGDFCSFPFLASLVFSDTSPSDWE